MKGNALRRCLILRDSRQTSLLFPLDGIQQVEVKDGGFCYCFTYFGGILCCFFLLPKPLRARECSSREVGRDSLRWRWDVSPVFSDTLTGVRGGEGGGGGGEKVCEGQPKSKSYRRRCHVFLPT